MAPRKAQHDTDLILPAQSKRKTSYNRDHPDPQPTKKSKVTDKTTKGSKVKQPKKVALKKQTVSDRQLAALEKAALEENSGHPDNPDEAIPDDGLAEWQGTVMAGALQPSAENDVEDVDNVGATTELTDNGQQGNSNEDSNEDEEDGKGAVAQEEEVDDTEGDTSDESSDGFLPDGFPEYDDDDSSEVDGEALSDDEEEEEYLRLTAKREAKRKQKLRLLAKKQAEKTAQKTLKENAEKSASSTTSAKKTKTKPFMNATNSAHSILSTGTPQTTTQSEPRVHSKTVTSTNTSVQLATAARQGLAVTTHQSQSSSASVSSHPQSKTSQAQDRSLPVTGEARVPPVPVTSGVFAHNEGTGQMGVLITNTTTSTITVKPEPKKKSGKESTRNASTKDLPFTNFKAQSTIYRTLFHSDFLSWAGTVEDAFGIGSDVRFKAMVNEIWIKYLPEVPCNDIVISVVQSLVRTWRSTVGKVALTVLAEFFEDNAEQYPTAGHRLAYLNKQLGGAANMNYIYVDADTQSGAYKSPLLLRVFASGHLRELRHVKVTYGNPIGALALCGAALERAMKQWVSGQGNPPAPPTKKRPGKSEKLPKTATDKAQAQDYFSETPWAKRAGVHVQVFREKMPAWVWGEIMAEAQKEMNTGGGKTALESLEDEDDVVLPDINWGPMPQEAAL